MGKCPYYPHLKACVLRLWKPKGTLEVLTHGNGFFMFKFFMKESMDRILEGGPYMFDGRPLVLMMWNIHVGLERDIFATVPVWINFPNLSLFLNPIKHQQIG